MIYGYCRVSGKGQSLDTQETQLKESGCDKIFKEKISGASLKNRKKFNKLLDTVSKGDTLIVTKLDRCASSTKGALNIVELLDKKDVSLVILNMGGQKVDTRTSIGKYLLPMLAGMAEFEDDLQNEWWWHK